MVSTKKVEKSISKNFKSQFLADEDDFFHFDEFFRICYRQISITKRKN